jgi:hypothetical protein
MEIIVLKRIAKVMSVASSTLLMGVVGRGIKRYRIAANVRSSLLVELMWKEAHNTLVQYEIFCYTCIAAIHL